MPLAPADREGGHDGPALDAPAAAHQVLYAPGSDSVTAFLLDPASGVPTLIGSYPVGSSPVQTAVEPQHKYAYVAASASDAIAELAIDPATGALTSLPGSPFMDASINQPTGLVVDAAGKFLYVANSGGDTVTTLAIDAQTGALSTAFVTSPGAGGLDVATSIALAPSGAFLYVGVSTGFCKVAGFSVDAGQLTALAGSPFTLTSAAMLQGCTPWQLVFHPNGQWLFAGDDGQGAVAWALFDTSTGKLDGQVVDVQLGTTYDSAFDAAGSHYYLASASNPIGLVALGVDADSGAQTMLAADPAPGDPVGLALDASGRFLYVTDEDKGVYAWQVGSDGSTTQLAGSPFATGVVTPQLGHATIATLP